MCEVIDKMIWQLPPPVPPVSRVLFMGVSLMRTTFFSKQRVSSYVDALASDGSPFLLVVADSLEVVNYHHLRGLSLADATERALTAGAAYCRGYERVSSEHRNLYVALCSAIEQSATCTSIYEAVLRHFMSNDVFRRRVQHDVLSHLGPRAENRMAGTSGCPQLEEYVLREVAVSLFLYAQEQYERVIQVSPDPRGVLATLESEKSLLKYIGVSPERIQYQTHFAPKVQANVA